MPPTPRSRAEAGAVVASSVLIAASLAGLDGGLLDGLLLALLTAAALAEDAAGGAPLPPYATRPSASEGVALGALSVPWALAGLAVCATDGAYWRLLFRAAVAAGGAWLARLALGRGSSSGPPPPATGPPPAPAGAVTRSAAATGSTASLALAAMADGQPARPGVAVRRSASARSVGEAGKHPPPPPRRPPPPPPAALPPSTARAALATGLAVFAAGCAGGPSAVAWAAAAAACAALLTHAALAGAPRSFTLGEASAVGASAALTACDGVLRLYAAVAPPSSAAAALSAALRPPALASAARSPESAFVQGVVLAAAAGAVAAAPLASAALDRRDRRAAGLLLVCAAGATPAVLAAGRWAVLHAAGTPARRAFALFWAALLAGGLPAMHAASHAAGLPTTVLRKGYHVLAALIFGPAALAEPGLLAAGAAAAAAALAGAELVRVAGRRSTAAGAALHAFMARFLDGRDAGPVLVSHFALLAGVAGPVWCAVSEAAAAAAGGGRAAPTTALLALTGVVSLGAMDTAASVVGRALGRRPLWGGPKTVEGAAAGAAAGWCAWAAALAALGRPRAAWPRLFLPLAAASAATAWLEAATTQLDNIFLPLHHLGLVGALVGGWAGRA